MRRVALISGLLVLVSGCGVLHPMNPSLFDSDVHIETVSGGCLIEPRPRPLPPPSDSSLALAVGYGAQHIAIDYGPKDLANGYAVDFSFDVSKDDTVYIGEYRASAAVKALQYGTHTVRLTADATHVYWKIDALNATYNAFDGAIDLGGPVKTPVAVRLSRVPVSFASGVLYEGALGIELEAFGVQTGFTLIDSYQKASGPTAASGIQLLLAPRWAVGDGEGRASDRLVEIRAEPRKVDSHDEYWHPLDYWPVKLKRGSYDIYFQLHLSKAEDDLVYVAPYRTVDSLVKLEASKAEDWMLVLRYGGTVIEVYRIEERNKKAVAVLTKTLANHRNGAFQADGAFDGVTAVDLGTCAPLDHKSHNNEKLPTWGAVGVEVEAYGLRTGFSLIAPRIDVQPHWTKPLPPADP